MTRRPGRPTLDGTLRTRRPYEHDRIRAGQCAHRARVVRKAPDRARGPQLRRGPRALQRDDRQAAGADRAVRDRRRRRRGDPLRAGARPAARRPRRRAQRRRPGQRRRRSRDRPLADEVDHRRRRHAHGTGRRGLRVGRGRRGHPAARARRADGDHLVDGRGGPDARRRPRLPDAHARPHDRQPAVGEDGARGRLTGDGERRREPRPLLGDPRRRRQLRRRHRVHVPRPPARDDRRRPDLLGDRGRRRAPRGVPRVAARPRRATSSASSTSTRSRP